MHSTWIAILLALLLKPHYLVVALKAVFTERYGVAPKIKLIEADRSVPGGEPFKAVTKDLHALLDALDTPHDRRLEIHRHLG